MLLERVSGDRGKRGWGRRTADDEEGCEGDFGGHCVGLSGAAGAEDAVETGPGEAVNGGRWGAACLWVVVSGALLELGGGNAPNGVDRRRLGEMEKERRGVWW